MVRADETQFYTSSDSYVSGSEAMRNEVAMLYIAGALMLQDITRKSSASAPFGGLGPKIGGHLRESLPEVSVLDVCCGPGNVANYLSFLIPKLKLTGIDKSAIFLEAARVHYASLGFEFVQGDARNFDLGKRFDYVTGSSAYHHMEDEFKVDFLCCIKKHLKENGRIILCDNFLPFYKSENEREDAVNKYYQTLKKYYREGNGTQEALISIDEIHNLELSREEEHKVHYGLFEEHLAKAGLVIEQRVAVWQPREFAIDLAGSYVLFLAVP